MLLGAWAPYHSCRHRHHLARPCPRSTRRLFAANIFNRTLASYYHPAGFAFAANGAHTIYLTDLSTQHLDANANAIMTKYPGTKVVPLKVDASSEADIKGVCQRAIKENGRLDVFFAAAGIDLSNEKDSFSVGTPEIFMKIQTVNALSAFLAIKHASDAMKVTGPGKPNSAGSIVTVASDTGLRNTDLNPTAAYHASKAAVISLCQVRLRLASIVFIYIFFSKAVVYSVQTGAWYNRNTGIRVNTICPGIIDTQMTEKMFNMVRNRGTVGKVGQLAPMGRFGIPEEIANAAVFLASDDASYM